MKYDLSEIGSIAKSVYSVDAILKHYSMPLSGGNRETVKRKIRELNVDTSHFTGQGHGLGSGSEKIELDLILVENSSYRNTHRLKLRLISEGLKQYICESCENTMWAGKPIPLELHHENGVNTDHRISNLKIICPNCHALSDTYRAKNIA